VSAPADEGFVHSWDLSTGVDGPGTRLVLFLSGCPMRCVYCQNPDTWHKRDGELTDVLEIQALMNRYRPFIAASGGGFTVSGGEPLQQASFARAILEAAKDEGLHTALDTSGFLGRRADDALLAATDLVLLDIKAGSDATHRRVTARPLAPTLEFARRLDAIGKRVWVRYVLVPGLTDDPAEVEAVAAFAASLDVVERVDVLPFHTLGVPKYEQLGLPWRLAGTPAATPALAARVRGQFAEHGMLVT
jgi:pyruvate formate lyase activating enzyme